MFYLLIFRPNVNRSLPPDTWTPVSYIFYIVVPCRQIRGPRFSIYISLFFVVRYVNPELFHGKLNSHSHLSMLSNIEFDHNILQLCLIWFYLCRFSYPTIYSLFSFRPNVNRSLLLDVWTPIFYIYIYRCSLLFDMRTPNYSTVNNY